MVDNYEWQPFKMPVCTGCAIDNLVANSRVDGYTYAVVYVTERDEDIRAHLFKPDGTSNYVTRDEYGKWVELIERQGVDNGR